MSDQNNNCEGVNRPNPPPPHSSQAASSIEYRDTFS